eukprot:TRINITY_DN14878_c0_g1_i3.p1 TRINITY_DN14878_c0_g1~~TRINITY_DN14878_c0_g1_i3.p1  ORF type:complete len:260 (+),score=110.93 TRINITY_DN14878_c0_g1_i3:117-896(+)
MVEISYQFWETYEERMTRLEQIWKKLKENKKNEIIEEDKLLESIQKAVDHLRSVRWKLDQILEKNEIDPIFIDHYQTYTRKEFLLGAETRFHKICALIKRMPKELKRDPEIGPYFNQLISYYKQVIIPEDTTSFFYDGEGVYNWRPLEDVEPPKEKITEVYEEGKEPEENKQEEKGIQNIQEKENIEESAKRRERKELEEKLNRMIEETMGKGKDGKLKLKGVVPPKKAALTKAKKSKEKGKKDAKAKKNKKSNDKAKK